MCRAWCKCQRSGDSRLCPVGMWQRADDTVFREDKVILPNKRSGLYAGQPVKVPAPWQADPNVLPCLASRRQGHRLKAGTGHVISDVRHGVRNNDGNGVCSNRSLPSWWFRVPTRVTALKRARTQKCEKKVPHFFSSSLLLLPVCRFLATPNFGPEFLIRRVPSIGARSESAEFLHARRPVLPLIQTARTT